MADKDMATLGGDERYAEKLDALYVQRDYLRRAQPLALQYWKDADWHHLDPIAICCDGDKELGAVWNYYRNLISSEPQGGFPAGRSSFWMVIDRSSNAFLGLFGYTSFAQSWPHLENMLGWQDRKELRADHRKHVQFLARCLPSETFGDLIGGKLLAMIATSSTLLHTQELRYSLPVAAVAICTLHGQGSQYNRLDKGAGPIDYWGDDLKGRGTYICQARATGLDFMRGDADNPGDFCVPTLAERIEQWRERWYTKRLKHRGPPAYDSKLYTLGRFL